MDLSSTVRLGRQCSDLALQTFLICIRVKADAMIAEGGRSREYCIEAEDEEWCQGYSIRT